MKISEATYFVMKATKIPDAGHGDAYFFECAALTLGDESLANQLLKKVQALHPDNSYILSKQVPTNPVSLNTSTKLEDAAFIIFALSTDTKSVERLKKL